MVSGPAASDDSGGLTGKLLVATPLLLDPNFYRTVVFIEDHNEEGALGIVLNRPTTELVRDHLPEWEGLMSNPRVVFVGGPVSNEIAIGLARDPALHPEAWDPKLPGIGLLDLALGPQAVIDVAEARAFSGYAGWVEGQLEAELGTGSWLVVDAQPDDLFSADPEHLWRRVLRRQPGNASVYASYPDDPRAN